MIFDPSTCPLGSGPDATQRCEEARFPQLGPMADSDPGLCSLSLRIRAYLKRLYLLCGTSLNFFFALGS